MVCGLYVGFNDVWEVLELEFGLGLYKFVGLRVRISFFMFVNFKILLRFEFFYSGFFCGDFDFL